MICTTTGVKTPSGTELNTSLLGRMGGRQKDPMQISHGPAALGLVVSMWSGPFFFFSEVPPFWTVQWSAWNGKPLSQQVLGSHSDWGSWRKATALRALWVPGEVLRVGASGHFILPGTKPSAVSFGFSSGSLPLTHCLFR